MVALRPVSALLGRIGRGLKAVPQAIALGLLALLGWIVVRSLRREMERVGRQMREQEVRGRDVTALERGADGVYRPKRPE
jgi:membrane protein implicated in regulation of membrane protease activity